MSLKWTRKGHEFDDIKDLLSSKKALVIYGAGVFARDIIELANTSYHVIPWELVVIDRDTKKQQMGYEGYPVLAPEEYIRSRREDDFFVICAEEDNTKHMKQFLLDSGVERKIIWEYEFFLNTLLPVDYLNRTGKVLFISENFIPSTICDLNCKSCLNFNPYIKKHIVDPVEQVKRDIDTFFSRIDLIYRFQLSGGEPFLYKDFVEIIQYIADHYMNQIIRLETITNGTIIPNEEICDVLSRNHVTLYLDDYRAALPEGREIYAQVKEKLEQHNVKIIYNYVEKWMRLYDETFDHSDDSEQQLQHFYECCGNPFSTLRNGKLAGCNYAHYAMKAGIIDDDPDNYFDLEQNVNKWELLEFRLRYNKKGYVNFCSKCAGFKPAMENRSEIAAIQVERSNNE